MRPLTRDSLRQWIKAKLGYPVVDLELSDDMLDVCIDDALLEVNPWVVQKKIITVPMSQCIDLSQYNVGFIINITNADTNDGTSNVSEEIDIFNPGNRVYSDNNGYVSNQLERMLYYQQLGYIKDNMSYQLVGTKLYIDSGYPTSSYVTIVYSESESTLDVEDYTDPTFTRFLKQFSLAYTNDMLGEIRGKLRVHGSPVELDYNHKYSKSTDELNRLRDEIRSHSNPSDFITD